MLLMPVFWQNWMYESDKYWENMKISPVYEYARQSTRSLSGCVLEFVSVLSTLNEYFVFNPIVFKYFPCIEVRYGHFLPSLYYLPCIMFLLFRSTPYSFCSVNAVTVSVRGLRKQSTDIPSFITVFINAIYWIMPRFWW
jgi:hypothetical protein